MPDGAPCTAADDTRDVRPGARCSARCLEGIACADRQLLAQVAGQRLRFRVFVPAELDRCPLAPEPDARLTAAVRTV